MPLDTGARHFVGAMPPNTFLDTFMKPKDELPPIPLADFSKVGVASCVPDMGKALNMKVQAVEKAKACPALRFFRTRTKNQWLKEVTSTARYDSADEWASATRPKYTFKFGSFPALAARVRPRPRKGAKKRLDIVEAYDYATALLDIEIHNIRVADPFTDPQDEENRSSVSQSPGRPDADSPIKPISPTPQNVDCVTPHRNPPLPALHNASSPPINQPGPSLIVSPNDPVPDDRPSPARQKPATPGSPASSYYAPFENPSPESTAFRASLVAHAAAQFARRHRVFFFQLVIVGRWARFIRWDRSGAISTERFDYVARPLLLSEFLWRFSHLTDEQRGLDPTVTSADAHEKRLFKTVVEGFVADMKAGTKDGVPVRQIADAMRMLDDPKAHPVWKIHVVDSVTRRTTDLLVGRPLSDSCPMFGRSTRAYVAYDLKAARLVFLKDTWRADHPKLSVESKTYRELKKHKVPHVLDTLYGGDVRDGHGRVQETVTQVYAQAEDDWRVSDTRHEKHVHHRIVQEIAYPLESALDAKEFVQVLHDVLLAVSAAYEDAGLTHRDISAGNIMIDANGRGVLIDWDHAGPKDDLVRGIGTWRFMSYALLSQPEKPHDIADDLESLFWVMVFGAMKWYALPDQDLPLEGFEQYSMDAQGRRIGGTYKRDWIHCSDLLVELRLTSDNLHSLLEDSRLCWWKHYNAKNGAPAFKRNKELHAEIMEMLELARRPSFWVQHFASYLPKFDILPRSTAELGPATAPDAGGKVHNGASPSLDSPPREKYAEADSETALKEDIGSPSTRQRGSKRLAEVVAPSGIPPTSPRKRRKLSVDSEA